MKNCLNVSNASILSFFPEDEDMDSIVPKVWLDSEKDWVVIAKSCVAELIGTLFLVLVGCGSCYEANADYVRY